MRIHFFVITIKIKKIKAKKRSGDISQIQTKTCRVSFGSVNSTM